MSARVLLVDDEPDILFTASLALRLAGYEVLEAAGGRAALEKLASDRPDALVLDLRMPEVDGWEVLDRIRTDETIAGLPVLVLSAHASGHAEERAKQQGATAYITKPFDPQHLVRELGKALGSDA